MRTRRERQADPFQPRSSVAGVLAEARASLLNPSRPYTPAAHHGNRHLLDDAQPLQHFPRAAYENRPSYGDRPSSAFNFKEFNNSTMDIAASLERFDRMRASAESSDLAGFDPDENRPQQLRHDADAVHETPPATPPSSATAASRPISSHGQRERPTVERQVIGHPEPSPPAAARSTAATTAGAANDAHGAAEQREETIEASTTVRIIDQLAAATDVEEVMQLLSEMAEHVSSAEYREEAAATGVHRMVASRLAKMVEQHSGHPQLLLRIARIMMHVVTSRGSTMLSTCKMLFKLSKAEENDAVRAVTFSF
eukprot:SAG31_NODE_5489_length_2506_cov_1.497300_2_plen_310_part_01